MAAERGKLSGYDWKDQCFFCILWSAGSAPYCTDKCMAAVLLTTHYVQIVSQPEFLEDLY